ncbi:MAG: hypothetical protein HUU50_15655, partial [Candidatus Brocadiae bacterium]|nr:hypothetical protein [Candidatus Brocadiia bacterium]
MKETSNTWPGVFGGQRVPFDPKVIFLGFLAVLIFMGGIYVIHLFSEEPYLVSRTFSYCFRSLGPTAEKGFHGIYSILPCMKPEKDLLYQTPDERAMIALLLWSVFLFFFFGGAISRMVAIGIAKDDTMRISQAFGFAWKHKYALFMTPFLGAFLIAFFYGCNWLAGFLAQWLTSVGPIVFILVFFLVLLSTFFMICLFLGLFCGIHLLPAAIGTEGCDGFEAGISVFCYIFYRPWSYIFHNVFLVISIVLLVWLGGIFIDLSFQSSLVSVKDDIASYHFDKSWTTVRVNYKSLKGQEMPVFYIDKSLYEKEYQNYQKRY